jgi:hypothetical protein
VTAKPEYTWGSRWPVHSHYEYDDGDQDEATVVFGDSGRIEIYFAGGIWDLYPCEASSLVHALNEALKTAELCAGENRVRAGINRLELHANTDSEAGA